MASATLSGPLLTLPPTPIPAIHPNTTPIAATSSSSCSSDVFASFASIVSRPPLGTTSKSDRRVSVAGVPMVSSNSNLRPRKRLSLLERRSNRPHTHHDHISRPFAHPHPHGSHLHHLHTHGHTQLHPHCHHAHPHPQQHTAHRTTSVFTPPAPHAKPRPNRRQGSFVGSFRRVPETPPPSPLVTTTFGLRLEHAFSRPRPASSFPGTPTSAFPDNCCSVSVSASASAPSTCRVKDPNPCPLATSASIVSLASPLPPANKGASSSLNLSLNLGPGAGQGQGQGHRRTLSNKVRTLLVGLMHRRRGEGFEEDDEELEGVAQGEGQGLGPGPAAAGAGAGGLTFGAPLRPHRSPGAASFHVTTKLTPTRSSSPPSRTASSASRDETPVLPHIIARPRTRRGQRLHERMRREQEDNSDDDGYGGDEGGQFEDDEDKAAGVTITVSRPCSPLPLLSPTRLGCHSTMSLALAPATLVPLHPPTTLSMASAADRAEGVNTNSAGPSVYVERPSVDSVRPSAVLDLRPNRLDRVVSGTSHMSRTSRMSGNSRASVASRNSRNSRTTDSARPSMDTTRSLIRTETKSTFTSVSISRSGTRTSSDNKAIARNRNTEEQERHTSAHAAKDQEGEALESRFSDTSDSEDDDGGGYDGAERDRPTSPFRRPWSSMPDLVRDQLRALAHRRGKSPELAEE